MTLSKRVIPRESTESLTLWDLPIVREGDAPTVVADAEKLLPTAEDIEEIQKQAYQEAYDEAFNKGHKEGLEAGQSEGFAKGLEEGKQQGYQQGLEEGQQEINEKAEQLSAILTTLSSPLETLDNKVEDQLVGLAMSLARHLIRRELKTDPTHVISAVRQAVELLPVSSNNIRVILHPEDATLVRESLSMNDDEGQRWKIVEDPMLSRGGCKVETEHSRIDATIESRINAVITQVLGGERESDNATDSPSQPE